VAGRRGKWTAIWFGGRLAWLDGRNGTTLDNHTLVVGNRRFVDISFNHRRAFVDAADVVILR